MFPDSGQATHQPLKKRLDSQLESMPTRACVQCTVSKARLQSLLLEADRPKRGLLSKMCGLPHLLRSCGMSTSHAQLWGRWLSAASLCIQQTYALAAPTRTWAQIDAGKGRPHASASWRVERCEGQRPAQV